MHSGTSSFVTGASARMKKEDVAKKAVGEAAATLVQDGQYIGLGTGSTAAFAIAALGRRITQDGLRIKGTPTSSSAELLAAQHGIPLCTLEHIQHLDYAFDGADEVDPGGCLIKGRGAAHTREKVVAALAKRFVVLVDESKCVPQLGARMPVPVEVLPMAASPVKRALERLGATGQLRMGIRKDGPVVTDQGFWVIDAHFGRINDPAAMDQALLEIPGVLDHGLFVGMTTDVIIGYGEGHHRHQRHKKREK